MSVFDTPKRLNYYKGQFLDEDDFLAEQAYHRMNLQRFARLFQHGVIAKGNHEDSLLVERVGQQGVHVRQGLALDEPGRLLVLPDVKYFPVKNHPNQTLHVAIWWNEEAADLAKKGVQQETRVQEVPKIALFDDEDAIPQDAIKLAQVSTDDEGNVLRCKDVRQFARPYRSAVSGWVRLPFLPKPFDVDAQKRKSMGLPIQEDTLANFALCGTYAEAPDKGADGCLEIPVPVGAVQIEKLRIAGKHNHDKIWIALYRVDTRGASKIGKDVWEIEPHEGPFTEECTLENALGTDDALLMIVQTDKSAIIHYVAAEFD